MEKYIAVAIGGRSWCFMPHGSWRMGYDKGEFLSVWNGCSKPHWLPYYWPCTRSIYAKARFATVGEIFPRCWWTRCIYNILNLCL